MVFFWHFASVVRPRVPHGVPIYLPPSLVQLLSANRSPIQVLTGPDVHQRNVGVG